MDKFKAELDVQHVKVDKVPRAEIEGIKVELCSLNS
jgi:hypothetical protein